MTILFVCIILVIVAPITIQIQFTSVEKISNCTFCFIVKWLYVPIYRINFDELCLMIKKSQKKANGKKHTNKNSKKYLVAGVLECVKRIKVLRMNIDIGYAPQNYIFDSYLITLINSMLAILLKLVEKQLSRKNIHYQVELSNQLNVKLFCIIKTCIANNIFNYIIGVLKKHLKDRKGKYYVRTASYRKFNGDSNEFTS